MSRAGRLVEASRPTHRTGRRRHGGFMSGLLAASEGAKVAVSNGQLGLVAVVAGVAIIALLTAGYLVREVLAASEGTANMISVARAVQEGAQAYLRRQF